MTNHRQDDGALHLVVLPTPSSSGDAWRGAALEVGEYEVDARAGVLRDATRASTKEWPVPRLFLFDSGEDDLLLIAGTEVERIPRAEAGAALRSRLLVRAANWQRAAVSEARRVEALKRFVLLAERLNRVESAGEVLDALGEHAPGIVGGAAALVFSRPAGPGEEGRTWRLTRSPIPLSSEATTFGDGRLVASSPGLVSTGEEAAELAPILAATGASALAYAGVGDSELLFIVERRAERTFEAEDWYHLKLIARQAEATLLRIRASWRERSDEPPAFPLPPAAEL